eukprot:107816-Rhodomonas_salina.1
MTAKAIEVLEHHHSHAWEMWSVQTSFIHTHTRSLFTLLVDADGEGVRGARGPRGRVERGASRADERAPSRARTACTRCKLHTALQAEREDSVTQPQALRARLSRTGSSAGGGARVVVRGGDGCRRERGGEDGGGVEQAESNMQHVDRAAAMRALACAPRLLAQDPRR